MMTALEQGSGFLAPSGAPVASTSQPSELSLWGLFLEELFITWRAQTARVLLPHLINFGGVAIRIDIFFETLYF